MENKEMIFEAKNITKVFPGVKALDDARLNIYKGEVLALIGENGAGKSTLMNILLGDFPPTTGEMWFKGEEYDPASPTDALERGISMIHQEISLVHTMTVSENIWLGREDNFKKRGFLDAKARDAATAKFLKEMDLDIIPDQIVAELAVADMQLVEIARAVSYDSDIIIMDEPTSALTNVEIEKLFNVINRLRDEGKSMIFISHKLDEIFEISDRITVLRDGQYIDTNNTSDMTEEMLIKQMVGRDLENIYPKNEDIEFGEVIFEVNNLTDKLSRYKDVSFEVRAGEVLGFSGLMGAGRSEIMEGIFGITNPASGTIKVNGKEVAINSPTDAIRSNLAMVTEDRARTGIIETMSVKENMSISYLESITTNGFLDNELESQAIDGMVKTMTVKTSDVDQLIGSLSGGNQQKVMIGRALLTDPDVLIVDEPTRGVDVGANSEIYQIITNLAKAGKAIIVVSSELSELMGICDRILVVREGEIVNESLRGDFNQEEIMAHAFGVKETV